jgi:hypothetical protein
MQPGNVIEKSGNGNKRKSQIDRCGKITEGGQRKLRKHKKDYHSY